MRHSRVSASTVTRRGAAMPEKNLWSHGHDALQHLLSGIDKANQDQMGFMDKGPPAPITGEDWTIE